MIWNIIGYIFYPNQLTHTHIHTHVVRSIELIGTHILLLLCLVSDDLCPRSFYLSVKRLLSFNAARVHTLTHLNIYVHTNIYQLLFITCYIMRTCPVSVRVCDCSFVSDGPPRLLGFIEIPFNTRPHQLSIVL